jgi:hypothetical protein
MTKLPYQSPFSASIQTDRAALWPIAVRSRAPHSCSCTHIGHHGVACAWHESRNLDFRSVFLILVASLLLSQPSPMSSTTANLPRPPTRDIPPQPTKSCPQLRHHLTDLVDHSFGAA